jgi:hypothetical protein
MKDVHAYWLDTSWEHEVKLLILASSQGNMPISDWIHLLEFTNVLNSINCLGSLSQARLNQTITVEFCLFFWGLV